ncbi:palmitoyl-protein thioesterase 1-like [Arvicanthis niloticus]|uniref:palmitoyl-protein thioesterase 1-like n=1 Tax=Arvicanthis niloticus TaxID=61156 RepID=UPI00402B9EDC
MVLPCSLWLLSVCLLSWCCDARSLGPQDLQSELWQLTFVLLYQKGETFSVDDMEMMFPMEKPGVYVPSLDIDKDIMEDVENRVLCITSHVYKILAKDPEFRHGYIVFKVSEALKFLCHVSLVTVSWN